LDHATFKQLCGDRYDAALFNALKDTNTGCVSKAAFEKELSTKTHDVFLTYDWGTDEHGRSNHDRVAKVNAWLQKRGIVTWLDAERMEGNNNIVEMFNGIENARVVVVFVTKNYMDKVAGKGPTGAGDHCLKEFDYTERRKTSARMLPVVHEKGCRNSKDWVGPLGLLSGSLYCDNVDDDRFEANMAELLKKIKEMLPPAEFDVVVRGAGGGGRPLSPVVLAASASAPAVVGGGGGGMSLEAEERKCVEDMFQWLRTHAPNVVPATALQYAQAFFNASVPTVARLGKKVARDGTWLAQLEMDEDDAEDIVAALVEGGLLADTQGAAEKKVVAAAAAGKGKRAHDLSTCEGAVAALTVSPLAAADAVKALQAVAEFAENVEATRVKLMASGAGMAVVAALQACPGEAGAAELGCRATRYLARGSDAISELLMASGAGAAVVAALEAHPGSVWVAQHACGAITNLAAGGSDAIRDQLMASGAGAAVVAALQACVSNATVAQLGCAAITNFAGGSSKTISAQLMASGAGAAVVAALQACPGSVGVALQGCAAITNLAAGNNVAIQDQLMASGAGAAVVAALQAHPSNATVAKQGCWAILNLCGTSASHRKTFKDAGAQPLLEAARANGVEKAKEALAKVLATSILMAKQTWRARHDGGAVAGAASRLSA